MQADRVRAIHEAAPDRHDLSRCSLSALDPAVDGMRSLPTPAHRAAGAAELAAVLADDGMVAAFRTALAGADFDDAGRTGPQRQDVPGIVGNDAYVLNGDAVLVENSERGEAVDDQH